MCIRIEYFVVRLSKTPNSLARALEIPVDCKQVPKCLNESAGLLTTALALDVAANLRFHVSKTTLYAMYHISIQHVAPAYCLACVCVLVAYRSTKQWT